MILSASASHALRAVASLAGSASGDVTLGRDLARRIGTPGGYLSKVLASLARSGILVATRGVKGGYRLARPADRIRLIEVVLPFEGRRALPGCLLRPDRPCRTTRPCSAHALWRGVNKTYTDFLEKTTVADIQAGEGDLDQGRPRKVTPRAAGPRRGHSKASRGRA
jgi:Rrf2 family protein